jgi:ferrous iron transport protein A
MLLKDINAGQSCIIEKLNLPFQMEQRLQALGMTKDTTISVLNRKGKGIMIIKLRGTRLALGYNMTKNIDVRKAGKMS